MVVVVVGTSHIRGRVRRVREGSLRRRRRLLLGGWMEVVGRGRNEVVVEGGRGRPCEVVVCRRRRDRRAHRVGIPSGAGSLGGLGVGSMVRNEGEEAVCA